MVETIITNVSFNNIESVHNNKQKNTCSIKKTVPLQARGPRGFQELKVPRFHDNGTGW